MQQIYLDNASTTFPKPQAVADAVYQYITHAGTNISRGTCATTTEDLVLPLASSFAAFSAARTAKMLSLRRTLPKA